MTSMVWFRRDLRVRDNPALREAVADGGPVVPAFCFDERLLRGRHASGPRTQFLLESLAELDGALRERGGRLYVRRGRPERELVALAREAGCERVHFAYDVSPFARRRGEAAARAFERAGVEVVAHEGLNAVDVRAIETQGGKPYAVFSPFHRNWLGIERRPLLEAPRAVPVPDGIEPSRIPELGELGLEQEVAEPAPGGEAGGRTRLDAFLDADVRAYAANHDALGRDRTSRLSPYLHLGCVSPRQIEERLGRGKGPQAFRRQLCWRDFYHHVLFHHPDNAHSEYQQRYRDLRWSRSQRALDAWVRGRTGYPLVDAGMRQLQREGWMHNRARMVVGSFLTKHLGIDWRRGERHFMRLLLDGDEANNNGNWQWIASVGTDPAPYYRRIYNPTLQMQRFDPDGDYVRRYVPELQAVPDKHLREPWKMPPEVQAEAGCLIGTDYPEPIVDHREAREEAIARYRDAAGR